jgi:chromosome segregation ATPase
MGISERNSRQALRQQQTADRRDARLAKEQYEKERQRRLELESVSAAQASALANDLAREEKRCKALQGERDRTVDEVESLKRQIKELRASNTELELDVAESRAQLEALQENSNGSHDPPPNGEGLAQDFNTQSVKEEDLPAGPDGQGKDPETLASDLKLFQQHFMRQRELLIRVLRKSACLEDEKSTLGDDVTRRNVIIHNLRQELQQQQQAVQQQAFQFQQQQQQQQQQHHVQQLQQLQQLQKLQALLQAQQQSPMSTTTAVAAAAAEGDGTVRLQDEALTPLEQQIIHDRTVQQLIEEINRRDSEIHSLKAVVGGSGDDIHHLAGAP